jgi:hypothetical protein
MKYTMLIKCDKCGYENFPQHRFCGMCAAELTIPPGPGAVAQPVPQPALSRVGAAAPRPSKPFGRPATARVEPEPAEPRSLKYLLEDEPSPSRRGHYVRTLVLLVAGAAAVWHWREDLRSAIKKISGSAPAAQTQVDSNSPAAPDPVASSPATSSPTASAPIDVPAQKTAAGDQATAAPVTPNASVPQPDQAAPSTTPAQTDVGSSGLDTQPENAPDADQTPASTRPASARPSKVQARAARASSMDDMEAEGEKYLYGNGVPENCGRARTNLLTAAGHSNAKAQNVLGTMYATGHCATRDLPTAYRWFGRALRQDPNNTRIEQDLKVLWNQMTPEEKQHALRNNS